MELKNSLAVVCFGSFPLPPPPCQNGSPATHRKTEKERQLVLTGEGRGREGTKSSDGEKAWYCGSYVSTRVNIKKPRLSLYSTFKSAANGLREYSVGGDYMRTQ